VPYRVTAQIIRNSRLKQRLPELVDIGGLSDRILHQPSDHNWQQHIEKKPRINQTVEGAVLLSIHNVTVLKRTLRPQAQKIN
jgi:hypothetical protein